MRLHPFISIILGYVLFLIFYAVGGSLQHGVYTWIGDILIFASFLVGGFTATYFAREKKIRYGLYEGILILIIQFLVAIGLTHSAIFASIIAKTSIMAKILTLIFTGIGGAIGFLSRSDGGYLFCLNCYRYYRLLPGESAGDLDDTCQCGEKLKHVNEIPYFNPPGFR